VELDEECKWLANVNWKGNCDFSVLRRNIKFVYGNKVPRKIFLFRRDEFRRGIWSIVHAQ
jgi:hypothetical protein